MNQNYESQKSLHYGSRKSTKNQSLDTFNRKEIFQSSMNVYGAQKNFITNLQIRLKSQKIENTHIYFDDKSRLIPNENNQLTQLNSVWMNVQQEYELQKILGFGSFGTVVQAKHRSSAKIFAIKHIPDVFESSYSARKVLREISILRQFSQMKNNLFTPKIHQIIAPGFSKEQVNDIFYKNCKNQSISKPILIKNSQINFKKELLDKFAIQKINLEKRHDKNEKKFYLFQDEIKTDKLNDLFIVQEFFNLDIRKLLQSVSKGTLIEENHIVTLLYNSLCALNFLHSANILHRDLKPSNMLVDNQCQVKISDFGLARSQPMHEQDCQIRKELIEIKNQYFKMNFLKINNQNNKKNINQNQSLFRQLIGKKIKRQVAKLSHSKQERCLTPEIVTRWYRPPEVILMEKYYDQSVDVWSLGCTFAEIIHCSKPYLQQKSLSLYSQKRFLFQGKSCFPISPQLRDAQENMERDKKDDQLYKIINCFKSISQSDKSFISDNSSLDFQDTIYSESIKSFDQYLKQKYPKTSQQLLDILIQMLEFNPNFRPSAQILLKNQIFDSIRIPALEQPAQFQINLQIDQKLKRKYNDNDQKELDYNQVQLMNKIKNEILYEIALVQNIKTLL